MKISFISISATLQYFKNILESSSFSHDFFQRFIKSPSREGRYVDADILLWLLDFLAKPTVIRSPLLLHCGRSGVDGGLWGSRSHLCNRFMVKCYTNAYKGFSLFLFPAPSFVSLSFSRFFLRASLSSLLPLFLSQSRLSRCFFLARANIVECIGTSEHPLVIVVANPLAATGICELPFASYRSLKPNEHFGQWRYIVQNFWESSINIDVRTLQLDTQKLGSGKIDVISIFTHRRLIGFIMNDKDNT